MPPGRATGMVNEGPRPRRRSRADPVLAKKIPRTGPRGIVRHGPFIGAGMKLSSSIAHDRQFRTPAPRSPRRDHRGRRGIGHQNQRSPRSRSAPRRISPPTSRAKPPGRGPGRDCTPVASDAASFEDLSTGLSTGSSTGRSTDLSTGLSMGLSMGFSTTGSSTGSSTATGSVTTSSGETGSAMRRRPCARPTKASRSSMVQPCSARRASISDSQESSPVTSAIT